MEQKTKRRIELTCIIALLFMMLPSADYLAKKAFADVTVTVHTPTGGALASTSDCTGITRSSTVVWIGCNSVLYAINSATDVMIDDLTPLPFTLDTLDDFYGRPSGTGVLIVDRATDSIYRFDVVSDVVTHTGTFVNTGCDLADELNYDASGFLWGVCVAEDKIIKINPSSLTTTILSQDLTDGAGIECDAPNRVYYAPTDNIGVIRCSVSANVVSFSVSGSTVTLLDSEAPAGNIGLIMDEFRDTVFMIESAQITRWTYNIGGLLTLSSTTGTSSDMCVPEYSTGTSGASGDKFFVCIDDGASLTTVTGFLNNSTGIFQVLNQVVTGYDNSQQVGVDISSGTFSEFLVSSNSNNQRYILVEGLRETEFGSPEPPSGGTGSDDNNQVGGACGNTDTNGDGRVNVIDCVGSNTAWGGFTSGVPAVQVVGSISDGLGLTECASDGSDQDTCGSGLFMFLIVLLMVEFAVLAGYLGFTGKLHADRQIVDVGLIMLIAGFVVVALGFYLNWIPDIVFYSIIAIIAGFLTFGIISRLRGG